MLRSTHLARRRAGRVQWSDNPTGRAPRCSVRTCRQKRTRRLKLQAEPSQAANHSKFLFLPLPLPVHLLRATDGGGDDVGAVQVDQVG